MIEPADILTPDQLAQRLKVSKSWVFEQDPQPGQGPQQESPALHPARQIH